MSLRFLSEGRRASAIGAGEIILRSKHCFPSIGRIDLCSSRCPPPPHLRPRAAILLVELVYAVVGIAWLVQYYQPCSDVTAKNLALGE